MVPPSSETSSGSAPASSSACQGRASSTCSAPSVASTATFIPFSSAAMGRRLPVPRTRHTPAHYGFGVPVRAGSELRRLLEERLLGRALSGRLVAGPGAAGAVRVAAELVAAGYRVALEHVPEPEQDAADELLSLVGQVRSAGLAGHCQLTVPVDRLGAAGAWRVGGAAAEAGLGVVLAGPARDV